MKTGEQTEIALDDSFVQNFSNMAINEMFDGTLEDI